MDYTNNINKNALNVAVKIEDIEIIQLLLNENEFDINYGNLRYYNSFGKYY